jgi:hypothetical protein
MLRIIAGILRAKGQPDTFLGAIALFYRRVCRGYKPLRLATVKGNCYQQTPLFDIEAKRKK